MELKYIVAETIKTNDEVTVFGNFSLTKRKYPIPHHLLNPMGREEVVEYFVAQGAKKDLGYCMGYHVIAHSIGSATILELVINNKSRYVIGA